MKKTVRRRLWPLLTTLIILVGLCSIRSMTQIAAANMNRLPEGD